jgi:hypothetical protein
MKWFLEHDLLIAPVKCVLANGKAYFSPVGLFVHDFEKHEPCAIYFQHKRVRNKHGLDIRYCGTRENWIPIVHRSELEWGPADVNSYGKYLSPQWLRKHYLIISDAKQPLNGSLDRFA